MRALVVGGGYAAERHVDALRQLPDVELAGVVGSSEARARAAAERFGLRRWTADLPSALAGGDIDVVHVCTPNDTHARLVRDALAAGTHVLCEKPLALDVPSAEDLVELAGRSDRVAVVCHNYRFFPQLAFLRDRVVGGELGRPHLVRGSFLQDWLLLEADTDWRTDAARSGMSRALTDIGSHLMDAAEYVTAQRIVSVAARLRGVHAGRHGDDQAALLAGFDGGLDGVLVVSQVAAGHANEVELSLDGSLGSATWRNSSAHELELRRRGAPPELTAVEPGGSNESRRRLVAAAYEAIRTRGPGRDGDPYRTGAAGPRVPLPTFADGLHQLQIVAAAVESARSGETVAVP